MNIKKVFVSLLLALLLIFIEFSFVQTKDKPVLAVFTLDSKGMSEDDASIITGFIQEELYYTGQFKLVERTKVDELLNELEYQQSGVCDIECAIEIGKQLTADTILIGTAGKLGNAFTLQIRLVDVKTGEIETPVSILEQCSLHELPGFISILVSKLIAPLEVVLLDVKPKLKPIPKNLREIEWVSIPAGSFEMGDNFNEGGERERPVHTVYLDTYYISKYEVTFEQYDMFCEATGHSKPSDNGWGRGKRPVINVSWEDAKAFCDWLSSETGQTIRLPTEAQWEKAARGTDQRRFPWGNGEPNSSLANYNNNVGKTQPTGSYPSRVSPYGVHDMAGNVWEWCFDWYDSGYYSVSPGSNPQGPSSGTHRVGRGGSWIISRYFIRSVFRSSGTPSVRYNFIGFRCARIGN